MLSVSDQFARYREALRGRPLPAAFVDLDAFERNVAYVAELANRHRKTIRVHSKSLRCPALMRKILETGGPAYRGVMTYSARETAWLAEQGFDDFIIAYPTVQPADLEALVTLTRRGGQARVMIDCLEHLEMLETAGRRARVQLPACLEIDVSYRPLGSAWHIGPRRSPIRTPEQALAVAAAAKNLSHVVIDAVMGYEAHIAGPNDAVPGQPAKNLATRLFKTASLRELEQRRARIVAALQAAGLNPVIVNGGGSGSLPETLADPCLTEATVGSAFYAPALFHHYRRVSFAPAAFFALQVVRRPAPELVTCQGGGYVASGPAGEDRLPQPVFPEGLRYLPLEGAGEVQTPLVVPADAPRLELGDPVFFQHAKAGELPERFNEFYLVRGTEIVDTVKTYRGEGQVFL